MFNRIMVPVDLAHVDKLKRGLSVAADMSKHYDASVVYVGVTSSAPGSLGHNPAEYAARLKTFAEAQSAEHGIPAGSHVVISHDPAVDMNRKLAEAITETGSDLVVMATHIPKLGDHFLHSHGGQVATHTNVSVFLVRG